MNIFPFFLFQDKFNFEPYGKPQDVAYIVLAPDNDTVLHHTRNFMAELSRQYEQCRLGKHRVLSQKLRDSTLRVGRNSVKNLHDEPVADWFKAIGNTDLATKLRLYAQVCTGHLGKRLYIAFLGEWL